MGNTTAVCVQYLSDLKRRNKVDRVSYRGDLVLDKLDGQLKEFIFKLRHLDLSFEFQQMQFPRTAARILKIRYCFAKCDLWVWVQFMSTVPQIFDKLINFSCKLFDHLHIRKNEERKEWKEERRKERKKNNKCRKQRTNLYLYPTRLENFPVQSMKEKNGFNVANIQK